VLHVAARQGLAGKDEVAVIITRRKRNKLRVSPVQNTFDFSTSDAANGGKGLRPRIVGPKIIINNQVPNPSPSP
jgi:hypothetical protein